MRDAIKVTVDHRSVDLPLAFEHTLIKREGAVIIVEHSEGLRVVCNTVHPVCSITISGWYFGKTGGLLGVYDNEASNDWMTPDREIVPSLKQFASSWQIAAEDGTDHQCPIKEELFLNSARHEDIFSTRAWELQMCSNVFGGGQNVNIVSPLMPCYSTISPEPYHDMCLRDIKQVT